MIETQEQSAPKLYNWVRAVLFLSKISAYYTCAVLVYSTALSLLSAHLALHSLLGNEMRLATLVASILLTYGIRQTLVSLLLQRFRRTHNYAGMLLAWTVLLLFLHFQLQFLFLHISSLQMSIIPRTLAVLSGMFLIWITWPKLANIQSLLKQAPL